MDREQEISQQVVRNTDLKRSHSTGEALKAPHFQVRSQLTLEILSGETESASRTVGEELFFIGSDEDCDLPLMDESIPKVLAVIRSLPQGIWIEAVARAPQLKLNNEVIRQGWVKDQDLLEMGPFQMRATLGLKPKTRKSTAPVAESHIKIWSPAAKFAHEVQELSAEQLLDRIVDEQTLVTGYEEGRRRGADSLLRAIQTRAKAMQVPVEPETEVLNTPPRVAIRLKRSDAVVAEQADVSRTEKIGLLNSDLCHLLEQVEQTMQALQEEGLSPIETGLDAAAMSDSRQEMVSRVELMLQKLTGLETPKDSGPSSRAIA
ncbi:MAG: FHA domain-containing protein [Planctomycetales bacterium]